LISALIKRRDEMRSSADLDPIDSENFRNWFDDFINTLDGDKSKLEEELKTNDVAPWSSGLVCGLNDSCMFQYQLIVPPDGDTNRITPTQSQKSDIPLPNDCPPGCDCDNPWPFLSLSGKTGGVPSSSDTNDVSEMSGSNRNGATQTPSTVNSAAQIPNRSEDA
jgi:hypothetical protein